MNQPDKENPLFLVSDLYAEVRNAQKKLIKCALGEIKLSLQEVKAAASIVNKHIPPLEPVDFNSVFEDE